MTPSSSRPSLTLQAFKVSDSAAPPCSSLQPVVFPVQYFLSWGLFPRSQLFAMLAWAQRDDGRDTTLHYVPKSFPEFVQFNCNIVALWEHLTLS